jgi:hypothetical protein
MTATSGPSYASAVASAPVPSAVPAAAPSAPAGSKAGAAPASIYEELYRPRPKSMTLVSALLLLDSPLTELPVEPSSQSPQRGGGGGGDGVYLMTREYLQNWLSWALHQPTSPDEVHRVKKALQLAAEAQGLTLESAFAEPGSIDALPLSVEGHPLVLRPNVVVGAPKSVEGAQNGTSHNCTPPPLYCCAVPERFYEVRTSGSLSRPSHMSPSLLH